MKVRKTTLINLLALAVVLSLGCNSDPGGLDAIVAEQSRDQLLRIPFWMACWFIQNT